MSDIFSSQDPWENGWASESNAPLGNNSGFGSAYLTPSRVSQTNPVADFNFDEAKLPASFKQVFNKYQDQLSSANDLERLILDKLVDKHLLSSYQRTRIVNTVFDQSLMPLSVSHNFFQVLGLVALEVDLEGTGDYVTLQFRISDLPELPQPVLDAMLADPVVDPLSEQWAQTTLEDDWKQEPQDPVLTEHPGIQKSAEQPAAFDEISRYINETREKFKPLFDSPEVVHIKEVPEKEGLLFKHINYAITHHISLGMNSPAGPKKVIRRYSDFVWLLEYLLNKYPFRVIPGLPPKKFTGSSPDTQFLQRRRRGLYRFLNQLIQHPVLRAEPVVVTFLNVPTDLNSWRKQAKVDYSLEFRGNKISGQFVNKIWPRISEEFLAQWKQAEGKILSVIELWTKIVILVERYERRQQQIAYDNNKYAQIIGKFSDMSDVLYPHQDDKGSVLSTLNRDDAGTISNSLNAIADFFTNSNKLIIDDSYIINTKTLEKFRNYLDYLYSLHELFERCKKLAVNNIPHLQARIQENEARYNKSSSEDADIKGSDLAKLKQAIINDKQEMFQQLNKDWLIKECCLQEFLMFQGTQYLLSEMWVEWCRGRHKYQARYSDLHEDLDKLISKDMPTNN